MGQQLAGIEHLATADSDHQVALVEKGDAGYAMEILFAAVVLQLGWGHLQPNVMEHGDQPLTQAGSGWTASEQQGFAAKGGQDGKSRLPGFRSAQHRGRRDAVVAGGAELSDGWLPQVDHSAAIVCSHSLFGGRLEGVKSGRERVCLDWPGFAKSQNTPSMEMGGVIDCRDQVA